MMHSLHAKYYDVDDDDDDYDVEYGLHRNMISSLTFVWRDETIEKCAQRASDRNICAHSSLIIQTIPEDRFKEEEETIAIYILLHQCWLHPRYSKRTERKEETKN